MHGRNLVLLIVLVLTAAATVLISNVSLVQPIRSAATRISNPGSAVQAKAPAESTAAPRDDVPIASAILRRLQIRRSPSSAWRGLGDELDPSDTTCSDVARSNDLSACIEAFLSPCRRSVQCAARSIDRTKVNSREAEEEMPSTFVEKRLEGFLNNLSDSKFAAARQQRFHFCAAARRLRHTIQALQAMNVHCTRDIHNDTEKETPCQAFREVVTCFMRPDCAWKVPPATVARSESLWDSIDETDLVHLQRQLSPKPAARAASADTLDLDTAALQMIQKNFNVSGLLVKFPGKFVQSAEDVPRNLCVSRQYPVFRIIFIGDETAERLASVVKHHIDASCQSCRDARVVISVDAATDKRASYFARDTSADIRPFATLEAHTHALLLDPPDILVVCLGANDARPATNSGPGMSTAHLEFAIHDLLRSFVLMKSHPEVFIMSPIPTFDVVRLAQTRHGGIAYGSGDIRNSSQTEGTLRYGRRAARMGTKVSPSIKRVVSLLQETHRTVHLMDTNREYLRWLERNFRRLLRQTNQLQAVLNEPIDEVESPLLGLHFHDAEPMRYLLAQLPDGRSPSADSLEFLAAVVLEQFFNRHV